MLNFILLYEVFSLIIFLPMIVTINEDIADMGTADADILALINSDGLQTFPFFGNKIINRGSTPQPISRRSLILTGVTLKTGLLKRYLIFTDKTSTTVNLHLVLQLWRRVGTGGSFMLTWQARTKPLENVNANSARVFEIDASMVPVKEGDMMGWTYENSSQSIISSQPHEQRQVLFREFGQTESFPVVGKRYEFQPNNAESFTYSVAVELLDIDVCKRCNMPSSMPPYLTSSTTMTYTFDDPGAAASCEGRSVLGYILAAIFGLILLILLLVLIVTLYRIRNARQRLRRTGVDDAPMSQIEESNSQRPHGEMRAFHKKRAKEVSSTGK